ncbi:MAG: tetratricopeptide repeat protein [Candidatus Puniceispirillales bacterium]|jgi:hypothetical protein|tara:strand:- start:1575 stop:2222 length:648 start_codon:yes stop_codon:yes gene_type:complete
MADIFDEVSEDLRQDQMLQIWKKYGKFIIGFIILLICSILGYQGFNTWSKNKLNEESQYFFSSLAKLEENKFKESIELFKNNRSEKSNGYSMLSTFGLAESYFKNNDIKQMISNYEIIYNNIDFEDYYRYLARFLSVIRDNVSSFDELHERLKPILNSPSKLQSLAAELEIMLFINFDKTNEAKVALEKLLARKDISLEQKNRLSLINQLYGNNE